VRHDRCVELKQEMYAILRPKSDARPRSAMLGLWRSETVKIVKQRP
jgi:hypothetical protein